MTNSETRRYEMLLRVREFGETHRDRFPAPSLARQAFDEVAAAVAQLSEQAVSKMAAARGGKGTKATARRALTERLEAMARCARVIAEGKPGFDDPFRMPSPRTDQALLTAGRVFVRDAGPVAEQFKSYGMPENFVESLRALVEDFDQAIRTRQAGRDGHMAARGRIEQALSSGLAAVRKLDIIVANQVHDDPVTIAVWERDRRVEYPNRAKKASTEAPVATVPPPPSPSQPEPVPTSNGAAS
jgi:hypothetical protein